MKKYLLKRILLIIPILIAVTIAIFFLLSLSPGDPALLVLGSNASEQDLQLFREQYGLDKSLPEQYLNYMKNVLKGDFGTSYATKQRVMDMVGVRIGNTLTLCAGAVALIAILGIVLGVCMALKQNSIFDNIARVLVLFFSAMPQFWLGMMLILLFCVQLKLLPSSGMESFKAAILPVICTAMGGVTVVSRTSRSSMLEVIHQDYIRTARAKGLKQGYIVRRHALKNALLPIITVLGRYVGASFGGAVVVETVFSINGIGKMMVDALKQKDIPTIMGSVIISALLIAFVNLIVDIAYAYIDPRIKSQYAGAKKKKQKVEKGAQQ